MSDLLDEEVPAVSPLSTKAIEELANCFLAQFAPESLVKPLPLDILKLIDFDLPKYGIHVCPASPDEIGRREGATDPSGTGNIDILISEDHWYNLDTDPPQSHRSRATVCHEIAHAVIHVPALRRRIKNSKSNMLARTARKKLKPYEDPEWQAWAFAGAILMPRKTLDMLPRATSTLSVDIVSNIYEVSSAIAGSHMRRIKF